MPNHIKNRLTVKASKELTAEIFSSIKSKYGAMDFNKILPMPKELKTEIHSGIETAVKYSLKMGYHENDLIGGMQRMNRDAQKSALEFNDKEWQQYIQCLNNVRKYGFVYWYDWSVKNWGTKWNAYSQNPKINTNECIYFETAWSAPIELIRLLSEKFPEAIIYLDYADEDTGSNTGNIVYEAGKITHKFQPKSQSEDGYKIYFELNPDDIENYVFVDGKYEYKDEE